MAEWAAADAMTDPTFQTMLIKIVLIGQYFVHRLLSTQHYLDWHAMTELIPDDFNEGERFIQQYFTRLSLIRFVQSEIDEVLEEISHIFRVTKKEENSRRGHGFEPRWKVEIDKTEFFYEQQNSKRGRTFEPQWEIENEEFENFEGKQNYKTGHKFDTRRESNDKELNPFEATLETIPVRIQQSNRMKSMI